MNDARPNDAPQKVLGVSRRDWPRQGSRVLPARFVLRLQQTVGNREVVRLLAAQSAQPAVDDQSPGSPARQPRPGWVTRFTTIWRRLWRKDAGRS